MSKSIFHRIAMFAAFTGAFGVIFGAFGAHALKERLPEHDLETLRTGVLYLFVHALAAIGVALAGLQNSAGRWLKASGILFLCGILFFSGSLFLISTAALTGFPKSFIGPITPIGGLLFILGWLSLAMHFARSGR
jgi:uncharacterized membrane protein YgdD (TMEM256/DUF423 family)